jgi:2-keto-4-pentenoate hydratase/2-oxohepta-3-ene-1,7-dioic acid hydratase in catechol pathway
MVCTPAFVSLAATYANTYTALAIDMTARNIQNEIKKKGLPWSTVKGFDTFTPIGFVISLSSTLYADLVPPDRSSRSRMYRTLTSLV